MISIVALPVKSADPPYAFSVITVTYKSEFLSLIAMAESTGK